MIHVARQLKRGCRNGGITSLERGDDGIEAPIGRGVSLTDERGGADMLLLA